MGLSRSRIQTIVEETLEESTNSLDADEIEEVAAQVAGKIVDEDPDAYDDEEEDAEPSDEDGNFSDPSL